VAIAISHAWRVDREFTVPTGDTVRFEEYDFTYTGTEHFKESHRERDEAVVEVEGPSGAFTLRPALNAYSTSMSAIGSPAVKTFPTHDVYVSLLNIGPDGSSVGLHIYRNPAIGWLWLATAVVAFGTLLAAWPARKGATA
jgi:cytochrome c-type biogenesis protein CcmF